MKNRKLNHWIVLLVTCSLSAATMGTINTTGIFFRPVSEYLDLSTSLFAVHLTILMLAGSLTTVFISKVFNRFSYRPILTISVLIAMTSTALMATTRGIVSIFILSGIRGISMAFFSFVPATMIVNKWFEKKQGLATGILFAFSAVITIIFSSLFAYLIENNGWQFTYIIKAILILLLSLPAILYPFNMDPKENGMMAYGYTKSNVDFQGKNLPPSTKNVFFISSFIAYTIMISLIVMITTISQYFPTFAESIGFDIQVGALLVSVVMVGNFTSKLFIGIVSDLIGELDAVIMMMIINVIGIIILLTATNLLLLYFGAFLFGAIFSVRSVGGILIFKRFFGIEVFPKLFPITTLIMGIVAAMAIPLFGAVYEQFMTFTIVFIILIIIHAISFVLLLFVGYKQKDLVNESK